MCTACISVGRLDFPYLCLIFGLVFISCFLLSSMLLICLWEVSSNVMKNVFYYLYDYDYLLLIMSLKKCDSTRQVFWVFEISHN